MEYILMRLSLPQAHWPRSHADIGHRVSRRVIFFKFFNICCTCIPLELDSNIKTS